MRHEIGGRLRILAADDSAVMRAAFRTLFQLHAADSDSALPRMELCGLAQDGDEALEMVVRLQPDVLLLDLEMPRLNGLGVLARLRAQGSKLPVIMCSAHTERGARSTLDALAHGAQDYVMKPGQQRDFASALDALTQQLLPRIAALAGAAGRSQTDAIPGPGQRFAHTPLQGFGTQSTGRTEVVVIGVSTGGPSALELMLPALPVHFPVPVLIVQHMPKLFTGALAERLHRLCRVPVTQARDGALLAPGTVWLAPGDAHMEVERGKAGVCVRLHQGVPLNSCRPSVDYLFRSAARVYGAGALALVMTGMGSDGLDGARAIHHAGGAVLAQDQASSAVWGMPGRVVEAGLATAALPLELLARTLIERVGNGYGGESPRNLQSGAVAGRLEAQHGML